VKGPEREEEKPEMWRGYHKWPAEKFEELAAWPSTFPVDSPSGSVLVDGGAKYCMVWDGLFASEQSLLDAVLESAELAGYGPALLNQGDDKQEIGELNEAVRKGERAIFTSEELAGSIWRVLAPLMPTRDIVPGKRYATWRAVGVNPTLRVLKYKASDTFELHQDGSYSRTSTSAEKQRSFLTLQIYLNSGGGVDFTGGATRVFCSTDEPVVVADVVPRAGRVLLFQHNIWHTGEAVSDGEKLVLRTEILFAEEG